jgi:GTP-binding protein Era
MNPDDQKPRRAGTVAIVGRPNVGKSTLLNHLIGQKVSITSNRPQTTRQRIIGILTRDPVQYVFVDTPGYQMRHGGTLNQMMNRSVARSIREVDVVIWVLEALTLSSEDRAIAGMLGKDGTTLVAVNKTDSVDNKNRLLPFMAELQALAEPSAILPVSAQTGEGCEQLLTVLGEQMPEQDWLYPDDDFTTASERVLAAELLREKLFRSLGEEIPYSITVDIEQFESTDSGVRRIHAAILVDKPGQKAIVIGRKGEKLKQIATQARLDMEKLFGGKVFLETWVKVKSGWSGDRNVLKRMGME